MKLKQIKPRHVLLTLALLTWGCGLAYCAIYITSYSSVPGELQAAATEWPENNVLKRNLVLPSLVMFVHPGCPCSRASLWELEELISQHSGKVAATIVMISDEKHGPEWLNSPLQKQAKSITGVTVVQDDSGEVSERFQARTSGETFLYSSTGSLLFHGGITSARGHMGDAPGQDAIARALSDPDELSHPDGAVSSCTVFGCRLTQPSP